MPNCLQPTRRITSLEGINPIDLEHLSIFDLSGGWPKALDKKSKQAALQQAIEYFEAVTRFDVSRVDGVKRDSELARRIMRSYARNQGSQATAGTILADIANNESTEVSENTIYSYIKALKKIFVIEDFYSLEAEYEKQVGNTYF